jgi:hypothetical protein
LSPRTCSATRSTFWMSRRPYSCGWAVTPGEWVGSDTR